MRTTGSEKSVTRLAAMPFGPRTILAAMAAVAVLGAAGCGSSDDKSIPPSASDQLLAQLQGVRDQMEGGNCALAKSAAIQFKDDVGSLPSDVDSDTKKDLDQLADNMIELTNDESQCVPTGDSGETGATSTDTSATEEPTTTEETTTSTTTSEETTTKPEEAEPAEPQQTEPPAGGSEGNQGGGNVSGDLGGNGGTSGSTGGVKPGGG
jgi:hypothetical protein